MLQCRHVLLIMTATDLRRLSQETLRDTTNPFLSTPARSFVVVRVSVCGRLPFAAKGNDHCLVRGCSLVDCGRCISWGPSSLCLTHSHTHTLSLFVCVCVCVCPLLQPLGLSQTIGLRRTLGRSTFVCPRVRACVPARVRVCPWGLRLRRILPEQTGLTSAKMPTPSASARPFVFLQLRTMQSPQFSMNLPGYPRVLALPNTRGIVGLCSTREQLILNQDAPTLLIRTVKNKPYVIVMDNEGCCPIPRAMPHTRDHYVMAPDPHTLFCIPQTRMSPCSHTSIPHTPTC